MQRLKRFSLVILLLIFTNQTVQVSGNTFQDQVTRRGSVNGGNLAMILLSSFIIGNAVAWAMGAYPRDFPKQAFSAQETELVADLSSEIRDNPDEADIRLELGQLYFQHNELDKAERLLEQAVRLDPDNGEALAVYSANEAKQAGAMWDFTWGLMKLNRMDRGVAGLNKAVATEPDNVTVRLYRMNTLLGFKNKRGSFHKIFEDETWFLQQIRENPTLFPEEVKREFYKVLAQSYLVAAEQSGSSALKAANLKKADEYRLKVTPLALDNQEN